MIRIVVTDDHALVRAGLCRLLETEDDIKVEGEAGTGREAIELCNRLSPDVLLLDFELPDIDGLETTRQVLALKPKTRILILTMYDSEEYAVRLLQAGAAGFIVKGTSPEELSAAIRKIAAGKTYITPSVLEGMAMRRVQVNAENPVSLLSDRELQVLVRLARGKNAREVADELSLSPSTVETYRKRVMEKLALKNISDLIRFAIRYELINKY